MFKIGPTRSDMRRIAKNLDLEVKAAQLRFQAERRLGALIAAQKGRQQPGDCGHKRKSIRNLVCQTADAAPGR